MSLELDVQAVVIGHAILRLMRRRFAGERLHQLFNVFELLQRFPTAVALAPVSSRGEPDGEGFGEVFVGMALSVPVIQMHDVRAAEGARPIELRSFFGRSAAKNALPFAFFIKLIGVEVSVGGFVAHQAHEPIGSFAFDFENHFAFEFAQAFVGEEKRDEDRRNANRHEPFVADVAGRLKGQAFLRKLLVKLLDERLEFRAFELEAELRDAFFQQLFVCKIHPIGRLHRGRLACRGSWSQEPCLGSRSRP